ncbi:MAG: HEPN domain-containing protein [Nitrososphaeria archaeon]|nr:HEPN domain-containing protein [Nitrososphaeria archaeon]
MKNIEMSSAMLGQAFSRLKTAKQAMGDENFAYVVRCSQECVELSLKASLRLLGIEYPKKHDVSRIILINRGRFPEWFPVEEFAKVSRVLAEKREPAVYGDELKLIPSSILFDKSQAEDALRSAEKVYSVCLKLFESVKG